MGVIGRPDIGTFGPLALACLYLAGSVTLSASGIIALSLVVALSIYLARSVSTNARALYPVFIPFALVYCAVQLDPATGVLRDGAGHIMGPYRWALFGIVAASSLIRIYARRTGGATVSRTLDTTDRWVAGTGLIAVAYNTLFLTLSSGADGGVSYALVTDALIISYVIIYLQARQALTAEPVRNWVVRGFVGLIIVAVLSGAARYALFVHYFRDAEALARGKDAASARESLRKAERFGSGLEIGVLNAGIMIRTGYSYLLEGRYDDALGAAKAAEALDEGNFEIFRLKGKILSSEGRWSDAVKAFERARGLNPAVTDYYNLLALCYSYNKQWDRGAFLKDYDGNLGEHIEGAVNIVTLAEGLNRWGRYGEALELAGKAEGRGVIPYLALLQKGIAREGLGDIEGAIRDYTSAVETYPGLAMAALGRLERLFRSAGENSKAGRIRQKALALQTTKLDLARVRTSTFVETLDGGLVFRKRGTAHGKVMFYNGRYRLDVSARSNVVEGRYPECKVMLDNRQLAVFRVDTTKWKTYSTTFSVEEPGRFHLRLINHNGYSVPEEYGELYVSSVTFTRIGDER